MVAHGTNSYVKGMGSARLPPNPIPFFLAIYTGFFAFMHSLTKYLNLHMPMLCTEDCDYHNPMHQTPYSP
jgi:hypothetical protein